MKARVAGVASPIPPVVVPLVPPVMGPVHAPVRSGVAPIEAGTKAAVVAVMLSVEALLLPGVPTALYVQVVIAGARIDRGTGEHQRGQGTRPPCRGSSHDWLLPRGSVRGADDTLGSGAHL